jgi:hypothetical protein
VDASLIAADANKQRSIPGSEWQKTCDRKTASRAVKEYLATLDDAAFGAASDTTPKFVSPSDPAAQWTGAMRGPAFFAYADNYLIDVEFGVIMDVEAYRASKHDCAGCSLKSRCCPNSPPRKVPRSIHEGARDMAREIAKSWEGRTSRRLRKKVEMLFAHLKRILKLAHLAIVQGDLKRYGGEYAIRVVREDRGSVVR